ncbi:MAG: nucleotidyltransferase family protein [Dehalococcoidia bacterium]
MATTARIVFDREALAVLCRKHHIKPLAFFGSVLRDDFGPDSDVDLLYEFEEGKTPGWEFFSIMEEFSEFFGRPVDLVSFTDIDRRLRSRILSEAQVEYEAA